MAVSAFWLESTVKYPFYNNLYFTRYSKIVTFSLIIIVKKSRSFDSKKQNHNEFFFLILKAVKWLFKPYIYFNKYGGGLDDYRK